MEWFNCQDDMSLLIASKSYVLAAWLLDDKLNITGEYLLQVSSTTNVV